MPKIYDQKQEQEREPGSHHPVGGPGHEASRNRGMMLAIVAVLAIILIVMFYRMARGEEIQGIITVPAPASITIHNIA